MKKIRTHIDAVKASIDPDGYDYEGRACAFCARVGGSDCTANNCAVEAKDEDCDWDCLGLRDELADTTKIRIAKYVVDNYKGGGLKAIRKLVAEKLPEKYRAGYTGTPNA